MAIQNILLNIHNASQSVGKHAIQGGQGGAGAQGKPVRVQAQAHVKYQFTDEATGFAPENIAAKRVGKNLHIAFEGGSVDAPDLIIENYYDAAVVGQSQSSGHILTGQAENGLYYTYVPESAQTADAVSMLADGAQAGQALGGTHYVTPLWLPQVAAVGFNPLYLAPLALLGAAAGGGGGGGGGSSPPPPPANGAPVAANDSQTLAEDGVLAHTLPAATDPDGDAVTYSKASDPAHGTVVINPDGTYTYTPATNYNGPDSFTYTVSDGKGGSNTYTVTLTVTPPNAVPVAVNDTLTLSNGAFTGNVLTNDTAGDGDLTLVTTGAQTGTNGGTFNIADDGTVTYTPPVNFAGTDTFTYTVKDANGDTSTATISVTNKLPEAFDDTLTTYDAVNKVLSGSVFTNDKAGDGDLTMLPASVGTSTGAAGGTFSIGADGGVKYTAPTGGLQSATDSTTYTVQDANGDTSSATITVQALQAVEETVVVRMCAPVDLMENDVSLNSPAQLVSWRVDVNGDGVLDDNDGPLHQSTDADWSLNSTSIEDPEAGQPTVGTLYVSTSGNNLALSFWHNSDGLSPPASSWEGTRLIEYTIQDAIGNTSNVTSKIDIRLPLVAFDDVVSTSKNTDLNLINGQNADQYDGTLDRNDVSQWMSGSLTGDPADVGLLGPARYHSVKVASDADGLVNDVIAVGTGTTTVNVYTSGGVLAGTMTQTAQVDDYSQTLSSIGKTNFVSISQLVFTPAADFTGTVHFQYQLAYGWTPPAGSTYRDESNWANVTLHVI